MSDENEVQSEPSEEFPGQPKCHCGLAAVGVLWWDHDRSNCPAGEKCEGEACKVCGGPTHTVVTCHGTEACLSHRSAIDWWTMLLNTQLVPIIQTRDNAKQVVAALVARAGGTVRLHTKDYEEAAKYGFEVEMTQQPGGFIETKLRGIDQRPRLIVVPGSALPRPPNGA